MLLGTAPLICEVDGMLWSAGCEDMAESLFDVVERSVCIYSAKCLHLLIKVSALTLQSVRTYRAKCLHLSRKVSVLTERSFCACDKGS